MVMNLESFGVDGVGPLLVTMRPPRPSQVRQTRSEDHVSLQVTQIVRFLLERGFRFRNLGFCGHDLMY